MKGNFIKKMENLSKRAGKYIDKHSPEILIGCGIVGFISTIILVAKEAPEAKERLEELHEELANEEELSKPKIIFEEIKTVAPIYAPAAVTGTVSIACVIGSYKIGSRRTAALATAYELSQATFAEYKNKVTEKIGEKKEREITHEINQDEIDKNPPDERLLNVGENEVIMTDGLSLFKLKYNGRYFRSNIDSVRRAEKAISDRLPNEMFIEFNEFQYELGLSDSDDGKDSGFCAEDGIDVIFDSCKAPNGDSCTVIDFVNRPSPSRY